ncbi:hypothetical protein ACLOJK_020146, partial [Asimina triloba]
MGMIMRPAAHLMNGSDFRKMIKIQKHSGPAPGYASRHEMQQYNYLIVGFRLQLTLINPGKIFEQGRCGEERDTGNILTVELTISGKRP